MYGLCMFEALHKLHRHTQAAERVFYILLLGVINWCGRRVMCKGKIDRLASKKSMLCEGNVLRGIVKRDCDMPRVRVEDS